jgi:hypothetical protein
VHANLAGPCAQVHTNGELISIDMSSLTTSTSITVRRWGSVGSVQWGGEGCYLEGIDEECVRGVWGSTAIYMGWVGKCVCVVGRKAGRNFEKQ